MHRITPAQLCTHRVPSVATECGVVVAIHTSCVHCDGHHLALRVWPKRSEGIYLARRANLPITSRTKIEELLLLAKLAKKVEPHIPPLKG